MVFTNVRPASVALVVLALAAGTASAQNPIQDRKTANDLKQLALAYHNLNDALGKAPEKPEDLAPYIENDKRLLEAMKSGQIVFLFGVSLQQIANTDGTSNTVLIYEKDTPTKGGYVAYADGSVKKLTADEFKKAILAKKK